MTKQHHLYGEYINPTIEQYSSQKENPLVLMAQACNNIGKELTSERKLNSPSEGKKSSKRSISRSSISSPPSKKMLVNPSSSSTFNSLFYQHLNQTYSLPTSAFSPTIPRSSYLMDSILSSPFVCNWFDSIHSDGFCGKRFTNHYHLIEHFCTEHSAMKSNYYPSTTIEKF